MSASDKNSKRIVGGAARAVEAGFTLLEIMVVLAIIALLAGGVGAAVFKNFRRAQVSSARLLPVPGDQGHRQRRYLVGRPRQAGRDPGRRQVLGHVAPATADGPAL